MKISDEKNNVGQGGDRCLTWEKASWVREKFTSDLSRLYFSDLNVDAVQDGLRYLVFRQTGQTIAPQPVFDLVVTMRSAYLTHGRNLPEDVVGQTRELNERALKFCVARIRSELDARQQYLTDASQDGYASAFMPRAESASIKGHRSLLGALPPNPPPGAAPLDPRPGGW